MASLTTVDIGPVLKEIEDDDWDRKALVNDHTMLTYLENDQEAMVGRHYHIPIHHAKPSSRSHDSTVAYDNADGSDYEAFQVTPVTDYLTIAIDGTVVRKAESGNGRTEFIDSVEHEVFSALEMTGDNVAKEMYLSSGGYRGRVHPTTAISGTTLTLANPADAVHFARNMRIAAASTDGTSGSLRDSGNVATIDYVRIADGTLVSTVAWGTAISGITNDDYLFQEGDFGAAAAGLETWNPGSVVSDTLFTVDRSTNPEIFGGMFYDGSSGSADTVLIEAERQFKLQRGNPFRNAVVFMNPIALGGLALAKEGQRWIDDSNEYKIGIEMFKSYCGHTIVADRDCPVNVARVCSKMAFKWCTTGRQPRLANMKDITLNYENRTDRYVATVAIDHNFASPRPQGLGRIELPTDMYT